MRGEVRLSAVAEYRVRIGIGLSAALGGCDIVSTSRGCTREYFGDMAWYCDPTDKRSIRDAVVAAYQAAHNRQELKEHILNNFAWPKAAQRTLEAYKRALSHGC